MNLKYITLSEICHTEKRQIPYNLTYMRNLENKTKWNRLIETENKQVVAKVERDGVDIIREGN